jgi:ABC-type transport system involved in multi-copper enzyme maturation permease subunit
MAVVTLFPVIIALIYRITTAVGLEPPVTGFVFFSVVTAMVGFPFVAPMLALFYSSGVLIDEMEAGTIPFLITRPVERHRFLAGKMIGSFLLQVLLFLPPMVLCFYLTVAPDGWQEIGSRFPTLAIDAGVAILGIAAYSGLFALLGTVVRRPVLAGLIFVFGWQAAATYVPGLVRQLTVAHYLQSLLPHESFQGALAGLFSSRSSTFLSISALLVIILGTHALAIWAFSKKEFPGRH